MPRQSRGSSAPRRPVAAPAARPSAPAQQTRQATTVAHPPAQTPPAQQQQQQQAGQAQRGPGLFGQMASTAAGVAVGSSIGHAIGGMFGGSSSSAPVESQQVNSTAEGSQYGAGAGPCQTDIQNFRRCMDENQGSLTICGWYLDQLKACQAAASQY